VNISKYTINFVSLISGI